MSKLRIMLVDDHTILRAGLKLLIQGQSDMEVVADTGEPREVVNLVCSTQPDVLVLDLSLPGGPSLPLIKSMSAVRKTLRVIVLTMHDDPAYVRSALAAGARGYVVKTISETGLLAAIRSVSRGQFVVDLDDDDLTESVFQFAATGGSFERFVTENRLSTRELEVLRLLGQGHSNQDISTQLDLSPKTVATYRARIADKLGLKTTAEYVKYAVDTGLISPGSSSNPSSELAP